MSKWTPVQLVANGATTTFYRRAVMPGSQFWVADAKDAERYCALRNRHVANLEAVVYDDDARLLTAFSVSAYYYGPDVPSVSRQAAKKDTARGAVLWYDTKSQVVRRLISTTLTNFLTNFEWSYDNGIYPRLAINNQGLYSHQYVTAEELIHFYSAGSPDDIASGESPAVVPFDELLRQMEAAD